MGEFSPGVLITFIMLLLKYFLLAILILTETTDGFNLNRQADGDTDSNNQDHEKTEQAIKTDKTIETEETNETEETRSDETTKSTARTDYVASDLPEIVFVPLPVGPEHPEPDHGFNYPIVPDNSY